jgi:fructokinase
LSDQVWVAGEVLIDLIPNANEYVAVVGGGPANTARALAKLGVRTQFIDGISNDHYGKLAKAELISDNVLLDYAHFSKKPTCTAKVTMSKSGQASYEFVIDGTATFDYSSSWLPNPQQLKPVILYIGTLATIIEPGASTLFEWAKNVKKIAPLVFDPNIRPAVLEDRVEYVKRVEKWLEISSLVKASSEDLIWLYPSSNIDEIAGNWLKKGVQLLVVTRGDEGIAAYRKNEKVSVNAIKVDVADTVGAGDTVGAILVEAIVKQGLDRLTGDLLKITLNRAGKAAAITCSRIGANPPSKEELDQILF